MERYPMQHFGDGKGEALRAHMAMEQGCVGAAFTGEFYALVTLDSLIAFPDADCLERIAKKMLADAKLWKKGKLKAPKGRG
jgi:hypothetical protein